MFRFPSNTSLRVPIYKIIQNSPPVTAPINHGKAKDDNLDDEIDYLDEILND